MNLIVRALRAFRKRRVEPTNSVRHFDRFVIRQLDLPTTHAHDAAFVFRLNELATPYRETKLVSKLAKAIHRTESTLRSWLRGESKPNSSDIRNLCEVTETSVEWLMTGKGSMRGDA